MSLRLQIIVIVCIAFLILYILKSVSKKKMDFKFGLGWLLISVIIMVFAMWPKLLAKMSMLLGIADPVNMLFFFAILLLIMVVFSLSKALTKEQDMTKKLAQELAILRKDSWEYSNSKKNVNNNGALDTTIEQEEK